MAKKEFVGMSAMRAYHSELKGYISKLLAGKIQIVVVESLPQSGEENKIYLVPKSGGVGTNVKDEYLWLGDKFELIGSTDVDLTNYYDKSTVDGLLSTNLQSAKNYSDGLSENYATAEQGKKADSAIQQSGLESALSPYAKTADVATAAQGAKADSALQPDA